MLGRQHLMLSFFSGLVLAAPFLRFDHAFFIIFVFGVAVGSLIPDVDANDAAIFHSSVRGLQGDTGRLLNDFVAPLLPLFGYATKYVIYRPAILVFDKILLRSYSFSDSHRSFSHSFLGVFTITGLTGIYLSIILYLFGLLNLVYLGVFLAAYASGCFLHLLQDSCTRTGIQWNSPFSDWKLKGEIYTGEDFFMPRVMTLILGGLSSIMIFVSLTEFAGLSILQLSVLSVSLLGFFWTVFMIAVGVEIVD